ncbi:hypothetical protein ONS95_012290 [Cadophora gregata]|uniref:uncharacterized protein n=1 Tax=Cadophora gregata TaxID=51156 RepID=UPI0026DBB8AC|nr:uncharacterized protein ONS95_012290 [Cadophora gregata]KAK0117979.1 hypothetical protein ONS95_012290 [Cadophora gregata]KAK0123045.1 hypothetical protein ONS96_010054 [Cadophora gregata f. sp. sojae]
MHILVLSLLYLLSGVLASPQGGPLSGLCGIPFLESITCVNGGIIGSNLPIKDLTCKFTLAATSVGGPNTPYAIQASDPSDPSVMGFGIAGQTLDFEIHRGVLSSLNGVLRATPASETSEKFSVANGGIVPDLAIKYKCLKDLPTLIVVPEAGEFFAIDPRDKGTYDEGSWYSAALGEPDQYHNFKEIDVMVSLIYS